MKIEELDEVDDLLFDEADLPTECADAWFGEEEEEEEIDDTYDACGAKKKDGKIGEVTSPEGGKFTHERTRRPIKGAEYRTVKQKSGKLIRIMKVTKGPSAGKWVSQAILRPKKADSVDHYDVFDLTFELPSFKETPEGYLRGTAVVTNIGVFEYMRADGSIQRELRTPETVFDPAFLESLKGKPITFKHPDQNITVKNFKDFAVGMTDSAVVTDPYHVAVGMTITDPAAIAAIKKGTRGISVGYSCDLVKADNDGRYLGMPYDYEQKNLKANHVALVEKARAGDAAMIRMDSPDASILVPTEEVNVDNKLRTINLDGVDYQAEDKVIDAFKASATRADELQSKIDALTSDKSALEAERDKQKERADTLTVELEALKKNHLDADKLPELIKNRVALEKVAEKIGIEKADEMSDMDIMVAVIKAKAPKANPEKLTDAVYVKARFDGIVEDMGNEEAQKADGAVRAVSGSRADSMDEKSADAARKAMIERERNAFRAGK